MTEQDLEQFTEYFQIEHAVDITIEVGPSMDACPSMETFEQNIPLPYKLASDMKGAEQNMLRPLRHLGDVIEPLADYLKAQNRKIDLMMNYILQSQVDNGHRATTASYGGGGLIFDSNEHFSSENTIICKIFFNDDATAIYCLGRIIEVSETDNNTTRYKVLFHRIRDEDREVIVRASLHQQSKQLLKKTQLRKHESN